MIIDMSPMGGGRFEFSYTGSYVFSGDPNENWELALTSSGTLTISQIASRLDMFLLGGGGGGGSGRPYTRAALGGTAGTGKNVYNQQITRGTFSVTVGAGGASDEGGGSTSIFGQAADGGATDSGSGEDSDIYAFDDSARRYGGNGGAGGWSTRTYVLHYRQDGGAPYGATGGQVGNSSLGEPEPGFSAIANSGGGGGGGGSDTGGNGRIGGTGGSGIIIIRNAR